MKSMRLACVAIAALASAASAQSPAQSAPAGAWKAVFSGPLMSRPKVPSYFELDIRQTDSGVRGSVAGLTGTVRADKWPHDGVISGARIDGNHVTFTSIMENGSWGTGSGGVRVDHCCPKLIFDGTVESDKMTLTLTWSTTEVSDGSGVKYSMEATRLRR
jgi:hypothetical protein